MLKNVIRRVYETILQIEANDKVCTFIRADPDKAGRILDYIDNGYTAERLRLTLHGYRAFKKYADEIKPHNPLSAA